MHVRWLLTVFAALATFSSTLSGTAETWTLYSTTSNQVYPVPIPADIPESPVTITGGPSPIDLAITPDGTKALVIGNLGTEDSVVNVLNLTQPIITVTTVEGFVSPQCIAITPDGTLAVVTDAASSNGSVCLLDLTSSTITIKSWGPSSGGGVFGVAITPDGTKALVANSDTASSGSLGVYTIGSTIDLVQSLPDLSGLWQIAVTPDGTKALATTQGGSSGIRVFDLTQSPVQPAYAVADTGTAAGVAITPDGTVGIVVNHPGSTISILDLTLSTVAKKQTDVGGDSPQEYIAISPDGTKAYTSDPWDEVIYIYDLSQDPVLSPSTFSVPSLSLAITPDQAPTASFTASINDMTVPSLSLAITPDQAPTASFTASIDDMTVSLDGSASSSPTGTIAQYYWDFGDGSTVTMTSPMTFHAYEHSGLYTISLTVTNSAGTSTTQRFTGKTVSNNGSSIARSSKTCLFTMGEETWRAVVSGEYGEARIIDVPSDVVEGTVVTETVGSSQMAITPDGMKAILAMPGTGPAILDLSQPVIAATSVPGFGCAKCVAITPDGTRALVTDYNSNAVGVLDLLFSSKPPPCLLYSQSTFHPGISCSK